jgi:hypothetical protein
VIWEPFILALVLGIIVSAGLYFAYLWPSVEPPEGDHGDDGDHGPRAPGDSPTGGEPAVSPEAPAEIAPAVTAAPDDAASPAP